MSHSRRGCTPRERRDCSVGDASSEEACGLTDVEVSAVIGMAVKNSSTGKGSPDSLSRAQVSCEHFAYPSTVNFVSIPREVDIADRAHLLNFGLKDDAEARPQWGPDGLLWQGLSGFSWSANVDAKNRFWLVTVSTAPPQETGVDVDREQQIASNRSALEVIVEQMIAQP